MGYKKMRRSGIESSKTMTIGAIAGTINSRDYVFTPKRAKWHMQRKPYSRVDVKDIIKKVRSES